jgi:hypothetical protein
MFRNGVSAVVLVGSLFALPASAAVGLAQKDNSHDRFFERLPDLRLVRGARPKNIPLVVTAEAGEAWTIAVEGDWMEVTPSSGTGPATVTLRFDAPALNALEDPTGSITITGAVDPTTNTVTLPIRWNIWPNLSNAQTRAELIAYARDPANWPLDGFGGSYELWGFLPDEGNFGAGAGANMDAWEKTPCPAGVTDRDDCVREGQAGLAAGQSADQAWLLSTGDPRVVIGELDSGIKWDERNLNTKFYLNARELGACPPPGADVDNADPFVGFDVNGDGLFNIRDYDDAPWLADLNGNGLHDPQDLIHGNDGDGPCSDGIDDDGNGYTDDISGWDFFWNDNDPSDDTDFGHGTGEANDSTAEAHDDSGTPGVCPRCLVMPVRVGDSFVLDVNQFADGVVFTVESGADIVQEALGSLNNTPYAQAAVDWAYDHNVPIIASAADETSYHHNYPGSLEHTIYVHAITWDDDGENNPQTASTFLNFNNCTNFGGHLMLSTPGSGCSSEATGKTAGQAGLVKSYFLQQRDVASGDDVAYFEQDLTAEEMYQILVASADDIDVPGAEKDPEALKLKKFPSNEGWDLHFGYGRNNARRALELIRDRKIPPQANISQPRWFEVFDPQRTPQFDVTAQVKSSRATDLRWELHVAEGAVGKDFTKVAEGTGAVDGKIGTVDLTPGGPLAALVARAADPAGSDPEQFSATLELRVFGKNPAGQDVKGVFRKTFGVRADPDTREGFPIFMGASGESSPKLTDLDGDGREEIVVANADGRVHAIQDDSSELPGFPALVGEYLALSDAFCDAGSPKCHKGARPFATGAIDPASIRQSVISSIAVGDLDGDGGACRDVVAATMDGFVYAFTCEGDVKEGFPVEIDRTTLSDATDGARRCQAADGTPLIGCRSEQQFGESGFFSSPALVDLDNDGSLEIVVGGLDSWAYAWHFDGTLVNGWPVHLDNPNIPAFEEDGNIRRYVDRIIGSPAVCHPFGDGTPIVFLGTNERVDESNGVFLYGIWPDGNAHDGGPFPDGWPSTVNGFIPDEILPFVGRGNPNSPVCADIDHDGDDEIINAGMGGLMSILDEKGVLVSFMPSTKQYYGPNATTSEAFALPVINNPSVADLNGDGVLDIINGTAGSGLIAVASEGGRRNSFDHSVSAWDSGDAKQNASFFHDGFPQRVWDYQFFMNYSVADLEGTGKYNVISGDGGYFVYAPNVEGRQAPGFPKWTQGWHIGTPAIGDLDGDQQIDIVANTREGWLWAWKTAGHVGGPAEAKLPAIQWEGFHHDDHNTGNLGGPLKPYPRLVAPDDTCEGGCCCAQTERGPSSTPLAGLLALGTVLGTMGWSRRRRSRG